PTSKFPSWIGYPIQISQYDLWLRTSRKSNGYMQVRVLSGRLWPWRNGLTRVAVNHLFWVRSPTVTPRFSYLLGMSNGLLREFIEQVVQNEKIDLPGKQQVQDYFHQVADAY